MPNRLFDYAFRTLRLTDGTLMHGRWRFESDGAGFYSRFLHAVAWADKAGAS
jgi:hypothetical protein